MPQQRKPSQLREDMEMIESGTGSAIARQYGRMARVLREVDKALRYDLGTTFPNADRLQESVQLSIKRFEEG